MTLEVFNVLGQLVRVLTPGETQVAGAYEVQWNGNDAQGTQAASGTYLVRFRANDFIETRKMVLLK